MIGLVALLRRYGDEIEADFQQFYGIDVWRELARHRLSFARVDRLIRGLPDDARLSRRIAEATPPSKGATVDVGGWPRTDRLLASIVDELAIANWQRAHGKGKRPDLLTAPKRKPRRLHAAAKPTDPDAMRRRLASLYHGSGQ